VDKEDPKVSDNWFIKLREYLFKLNSCKKIKLLLMKMMLIIFSVLLSHEKDLHIMRNKYYNTF
jgi:hypothetical protein